jgi:hypothetical protein
VTRFKSSPAGNPEGDEPATQAVGGGFFSVMHPWQGGAGHVPFVPAFCGYFSMMHFWQGGAGHIPYVPAQGGTVLLRRISMPLGSGL